MIVSSRLPSDPEWVPSTNEYQSFAEAAQDQAALAGARIGDEIKIRDEDSGEIRAFKVVAGVREVKPDA